MMHKAWHSIEEVPHCFMGSSIKFRGYMGIEINYLIPILIKITRPVAAIKSLRFALVIDISMELKAYQLCYKQIEHWKYYIRKWHNYGPALSKSSIDFLIPVRAHNAGTTYYEWELHRKRNQTTAVPCTIKKPPRWWTPHIAAKPIPFMQKNYTVIILWGQHLLFVASTLPKEWWVIITMKCQRSGKLAEPCLSKFRT